MTGRITAAYSLGRITASTSMGRERFTQSLRMRDSLFTFSKEGPPEKSGRLQQPTPPKKVGDFGSQEVAWGPRRIAAGIRRDHGDRSRFLKGATYWSGKAAWGIGG